MCKKSFLKRSLVIYATYYCFSLIMAMDNHDVVTNAKRVRRGNWKEINLTNLLCIETHQEHKELIDLNVWSTFLSEVKKGFKNELRSSTEEMETNNNLLVKYKQEFETILKGLYSEILELKRNLSEVTNYPSSGGLTESELLEGSSYPVGVSFRRLCHPSALKKPVTEIKEYYPSSCKEIQKKGNNVSGKYQIQPKNSGKSFMVLCDMEIRGGGWTHIQKRYDGSVDFFRSWRDYKFGFGDLESEFWIGLENIYKMTDCEPNELLIEITDRTNQTVYAHYNAFGVGPEVDGYPLKTLNGFSGNAGDALTYHFGAKFSTADFDQDTHSGNCAQLYTGAWWYKDCQWSNLNGKYLNVDLPVKYRYGGLHWAGFRNHDYCNAKSRMMIRPVG